MNWNLNQTVSSGRWHLASFTSLLIVSRVQCLSGSWRASGGDTEPSDSRTRRWLNYVQTLHERRQMYMIANNAASLTSAHITASDKGWQLVCVCVTTSLAPGAVFVSQSVYLLTVCKLQWKFIYSVSGFTAVARQLLSIKHTHQLRRSYYYPCFYNMQHTKSVELFPAKTESVTGPVI